MKKYRGLMVVVLSWLMILLTGACQTNNALEPSGSLVAHTDCLQTFNLAADAFAPVTQECVRYQSKAGVVTLSHEGAIFNCEPGEISGTVTIDGNQIVIHEQQSQAGAHCLCPYNLDYVLQGLSLPNYRLTLYTYDNRLLSLDIQTAAGSEGEFCQDSQI